MQELVAPVADDSDRVIEMARIWIDGDAGVSHISLNYGIFERQELEIWGSLAADLIAHAVNAYFQDGGTETADAAFALIEKGLRGRLAEYPTLKGQIGGRALS